MDAYIARERGRRNTPPKPELYRAVELGTPWTLEGDWMIVGDVHVPTTNYDFSVLVTAVARKWLKPPRKLLIAGDLFNMDEFSRFDKIGKLATWYQERDAAHQLFKEWLEVFSEVRFMMGNHDRRIQKWTDGAMGGVDLIASILMEVSEDGKVESQIGTNRVWMSDWGWCTINTERGPWRVTHPKNYSINQLTTGDALAQKFLMNVITHHEHHVAMGYDRYKRFLVVNNGGLHDHRQMEYVQKDDSKSAGMANSFVMLRGGYAHLFGDEQFTDYGRWLG